jgi:hypothetical protein
MSAADHLRVIGLAAQAEMALVRRDGVAGPLLAQTARAAERMPPAALFAAASALVRKGVDDEAMRRAALSLCRMGLQEAQADALGGGAR